MARDEKNLVLHHFTGNESSGFQATSMLLYFPFKGSTNGASSGSLILTQCAMIITTSFRM